MALELKKNKYSELNSIDKDTWMDIGLKVGIKRSVLSEVWNNSMVHKSL